jgi:hypothetical protein
VSQLGACSTGCTTEGPVANENVTQLRVQPKTIVRKYMGDEITLQFDPSGGRWNWSIRAMRVVSFNGHAATERAASQAAEKAIDEMHGVRARYPHT